MNLHLWALAVCILIQKASMLDLKILDPTNTLDKTNLQELENNLSNITLVPVFLKNHDVNLTALDLFKNEKTFTQIANETGLQVSEHEVTTTDGYKLSVFHIESNGTNGPVLLIHGFIDSSDTFMLRRNSSITKVLVDAGYDVWLINVRGNKYSRKHVSKNPDKDKDYWDFTFNEMGTEDLPRVIDYVLSKTNHESLYLIGHSQGTQIIFVLASEKPEYNNKIKAVIALAPICFLQNIYQSAFQILIELAPFLAIILEILGVKELIADKGIIRTIEQVVCPIDDLGYVICLDGVLNPAVGADNDQLEPSFFKEDVVPQYPTSTSVKNALHLVQLNKLKRFAKYDEGTAKNLIKYSSPIPPKYDLSKVTVKVFTFEGQNDKLSTIKDTDLLAAQLPNIHRTILERPEMNHFDFVWGKDAYDYLYADVLKVMKEK